jgi:hypothetical protein
MRNSVKVVVNTRGNVTTRNSRFTSNVVLRYLRQRRRTGRCNACVHRETVFCDSGHSFPFMNMTIKTGTNVIAKTEAKPTARILVQARDGRCGLPAPLKGRLGGMNHNDDEREEHCRPNLLRTIDKNLPALRFRHGGRDFSIRRNRGSNTSQSARRH